MNELLNTFPLIALYAELHYRLKYIGSRYYIDEPEILADLPYRIEPGYSIPILLLIKDSHLYPIHLDRVSIYILKSSKILLNKELDYDCHIENAWWEDTIYLNTQGIRGIVQIQVKFNYSVNGKEKQNMNHNFPQSRQKNLECLISEYNYPRDAAVQYGDLHYHTNLTEDMVEYGAPLRASLIAAESMGIDFYCNTDHSYDLDDKPGSWTEIDPELTKWKNSRNEIKCINKDPNLSSFIIPSEELTLHNHKGNNIHALILNNSDYLPGSGDSGEKFFNTNSEYNTQNVHDYLEDESLCIAAHPFNSVPFFQRILLNRGSWKDQDIQHAKISGLQISNGELDSGYHLGVQKWILFLLNGLQKYIYAGNDAHGNFNIYRQIKAPMLTLFEKKEQIFGKYRTGIYAEKQNDIQSAVEALRDGKCFITNGPLINITCEIDNKLYKMGSQIKACSGTIIVHGLSSPEFGEIKYIRILKGVLGEKKESVSFTLLNPRKYEVKQNYNIYADTPCYYRCEIKIDSAKDEIFGLTNPIWFYPS